MLILTLRSIAFNLVYVLWTAFCSTAFLPFLLLPPRYGRWIPPAWAKPLLYAHGLICNVRYEVRGREYMSSTPVIYASKHQSAWDIIIFLHLFPNCAFVLKEELTRIPLYGKFLLHTGMIAINRAQGASAIKHMVRTAKQAAAHGRPIVIYPEGTRTLPGAKTTYHPGIAALYSQLALPVVPVALNSGVLWPRNAFLKHPGTLTIEFLPPVPPGQPPRELIATLQPVIEQASEKLYATAHAVNQ